MTFYFIARFFSFFIAGSLSLLWLPAGLLFFASPIIFFISLTIYRFISRVWILYVIQTSVLIFVLMPSSYLAYYVADSIKWPFRKKIVAKALSQADGKYVLDFWQYPASLDHEYHVKRDLEGRTYVYFYDYVIFMNTGRSVYCSDPDIEKIPQYVFPEESWAQIEGQTGHWRELFYN